MPDASSDLSLGLMAFVASLAHLTIAAAAKPGCAVDGQPWLCACSVEREGFLSNCTCLACNTECDENCGCRGLHACQNSAVSQRRPLRLGQDLAEVDAWGLDCYVRRNILDGKTCSSAGSPACTTCVPLAQSC